jgi:hypothetical protein
VGAVAALAAAGVVFAEESEKKDEVFKLKTTVTITGAGIVGNPLVAFDISWVDPFLHTYYLADRTNNAIDAIDTKTKGLKQLNQGGFVGNTGVNNTSGPDGVLTAENSTQLWVGDGKSRVWVLNPTTGAVLTAPPGGSNPIYTTLPAGSNPNRADEMCFDPVDHLVMAANNADDPPFATLFSTTSFKVVGKIVFDKTNVPPNGATNGAEQCQWSPRTGLFYISLPGINDPDDGTGAVAVIDPKIGMAPNVGKIVKIFKIPLADCAAPQGMAVGPDRQILLGCNGSSTASAPAAYNTVIINEISGSVIKTLRNQGGNDEVWYNPGDGHYFLAEGQQTPLGAAAATTPYTEQLGVVDSAGKRPDKAVATGTNCNTTRRAHSVAADPDANQAYVPIPGDTGTAGTCPFFESDLCPDPTHGCVAIFGPVGKDDHPRPIVKPGDDDDDHQGDNNHQGDDRQE